MHPLRAPGSGPFRRLYCFSISSVMRQGDSIFRDEFKAVVFRGLWLAVSITAPALWNLTAKATTGGGSSVKKARFLVLSAPRLSPQQTSERKRLS